MANKNPLKGVYTAATESPDATMHAKSANGLRGPSHKAKVANKGRPAVEMPRGHGLRQLNRGRDNAMGNTLPGMKEPKK